MTPRYRHWMQPASEGRWPSAIVCVDCVGSCAASANRTGALTERLVSWHLVRLSSVDGVYTQDAELAGQDAEWLWRWLAGQAIHEPNLWIVSHCCNRVWSLLNLWERIEDGRIILSDTDHRDSQARQQRERDYRRRQADPLRSLSGAERHRINAGAGGYLVVEDPPNILRGRLYSAGHCVTWVDSRNHGIEAPAAVESGAMTARWLGATVSRMSHLCRAHGLTSLKATAGAQAMGAWRHSHLSEGVYVHTDGRATETERDGYVGGRCEATVIGVVRSPVVHLDFRSQYGWVCANCRLPTGLLHHCTGERAAEALQRGRADSAIAKVTVETDEPAYPVRRDDEVIYPVGRYRTTLCGPELADAISLGRVRAVHSVALYAMGYPLRDYAQALWLLRRQEDTLGEYATACWAKRLMVTLPGRLGQRAHRWVDAPEVIPATQYGEWYGHDDDGEPIRYRAIGGIVQRDTCDGFSADAVPSVAAFVTSAGRMRLLGAIRTAEWANVHYYDTDSVFVNALGYERLLRSEYMVSDGLGALTVRSTPEALEIRGIKYYVEDTRVVCAGLSHGLLVDAGDGRTYSRYLSAVEQARHGERPEATVIQGTYARAEAYTAGMVGPDGRVTPLRLEEE